MTALELLLLAGSLLCVAGVWISRVWGQSLAATLSAAVLFMTSPAAGTWLAVSALMVPALLRLGDRWANRGHVAVLLILVLAGALMLSRELDSWVGVEVLWIGGAYFTLRHVHVIVEWWLGRLEVPSTADYLRYHFFLPVMMVGPIHRFPNFQRECQRRRWEPEAFYAGAERALIGLAVAVAIGRVGFERLIAAAEDPLSGMPRFVQLWGLSALEWLQLYFQFAGLTALALGLSLMAGLRLEENFNRPWQARILTDFWLRWHMTLSHWCRDYVFAPIAAAFRAPVVGVLAAMMVLGLWHETSVYYLLWGFWQAAGIVLTQAYRECGDPLRLRSLPGAVAALVGPASVLAWLAAARPVIDFLMRSFGL